jgi:hypothetical protein
MASIPARSLRRVEGRAARKLPPTASCRMDGCRVMTKQKDALITSIYRTCIPLRTVLPDSLPLKDTAFFFFGVLPDFEGPSAAGCGTVGLSSFDISTSVSVTSCSSGRERFDPPLLYKFVMLWFRLSVAGGLGTALTLVIIKSASFTVACNTSLRSIWYSLYNGSRRSTTAATVPSEASLMFMESCNFRIRCCIDSNVDMAVRDL